MSALLYAFRTGTRATDHRSGKRVRTRLASARVLFAENRRLSPRISAPFRVQRVLEAVSKKRRDDNIGSPDSQEQQDHQGRIKKAGAKDWQNVVRNTNDSIWSLPVYDFVDEAIRRDQEWQEAWKSRGFVFIRLLKGFFKEGVTAGSAFETADAEIKKRGGWNCTLGFESDEEAYTEFCATWKKVRFRPDASPLHQALAKAKTHPINAPKNAERTRPTPGYDRFISFCGWLQLIRNEEPIFLPVRQIAELLETDQRMISIWRQMALEEELLQKVADHQFKPGTRPKATTFRVNPSFMPWFRNYIAKRT